MKRRWEEVVEVSDEELEKRREELRSQVTSPVKPTPPPSNTNPEASTPAAEEDKDEDDLLPLKRVRRALAKKRSGKFIPQGNQGSEGLQVSDEIKEQLPYPVRGVVNAIGDHYTIKQWSSITSGSTVERIKLVHAHQIAATMGASALYTDLIDSITALEKRVIDGEKNAAKDKGEIEKLKRDMGSADKTSREIQLKHVKLEKAFESEKKRSREELEVEKNAVVVATEQVNSLQEEITALKASKERDIALAKLEASDMKGPIMQPILKKLRHRYYEAAVDDMKSQFPDHDYTFVDNEIAVLLKTLKGENPQEEGVQGGNDKEVSGSGPSTLPEA